MAEIVTKVADPTDPLIAPLPRDPTLTPAQRAAARFSVNGNAIVTGGAGGLGSEACTALLEHGIRGLAIFDTPTALSNPKTIERLGALRAEFPSVKIIELEVDVREEATVRRGVEETVRELGSVDHLACFAGVGSLGNSVDVELKDWERVLGINLTGSWLCAQAVGKQMIAQGTGGRIIFIASLAGQRASFPFPTAAYSTSKAGVRHLAQCLAGEWARYGIRVNSISPGWMDTQMVVGVGRAGLEASLARTPMARAGEPDELNGAVVFLCSPASHYITGIDLLVTGGSHVFL